MASVEENWHTSGDSDIAIIGLGMRLGTAFSYLLIATLKNAALVMMGW